MPDKLETKRLERYLNEALANFDDLSEWEQQFVKGFEDRMEEIPHFMVSVSQGQWDVWFKIMEKLGVQP